MNVHPFTPDVMPIFPPLKNFNTYLREAMLNIGGIQHPWAQGIQ